MANIVHSMFIAVVALSAGCVASPVEQIDSPAVDADAIEIPVEPGDQTGEAQQPVALVSFSRSDFPFVTIVEDDGIGKAGGWQMARPSLNFSHVVFPTRVDRWQCTFAVEMPIRTETMGRFSPRRAAEVSAKIANDVGRRMDYKLPEGIFCTTFIRNMDKTFKSPPYRKVGASVHL